MSNQHPESQTVSYRVLTPSGWSHGATSQEVTIAAHSSVTVDLKIVVPEARYVENSNRLYLETVVEGRPLPSATPVVLIGANRYFHSEIFPADGRSDQERCEQAFGPEQAIDADLLSNQAARGGQWTGFYAYENSLPLAEIFAESGVLYVRTFLWNPGADVKAWLGAPANCPTKLWVNNQVVKEAFSYPLVRPNYGGNRETYATVELKKGWNEVLIKFVRGTNAQPFDGYLLFSTADNLNAGLYRIGRTRAPWEE